MDRICVTEIHYPGTLQEVDSFCILTSDKDLFVMFPGSALIKNTTKMYVSSIEFPNVTIKLNDEKKEVTLTEFAEIFEKLYLNA